MSDMAAFVKWCRREQKELQAQLQPLEAGTAHIGKRPSGGIWVDITKEEVMRLKKGIAQFDTLIAQYS